MFIYKYLEDMEYYGRGRGTLIIEIGRKINLSIGEKRGRRKVSILRPHLKKFETFQLNFCVLYSVSITLMEYRRGVELHFVQLSFT